MAVTTISASLSETWTEMVDGAAYSSGLIQASSPIALAVAGSLPAAGTVDYIVVSQDQPLFSLALGTSDLIYARALNGSSTIRIIRTGV